MLSLLINIYVVSSFAFKSHKPILTTRLYCIKDILIDSTRQNSILLFGKLAQPKLPFCPEQLSTPEPYAHTITNHIGGINKSKWSQLFYHPSEQLDFKLFITRLSTIQFYWPIYLDNTIVESNVYAALIDALFTKIPICTLQEKLTGNYKNQIHTRSTTRSAINKSLTNCPIPQPQAHQLFNLVSSFGNNKTIGKHEFSQFINTVESKFGPVSFEIFESLINPSSD